MLFFIGKDFRKGKAYSKYLLVCRASGDGELASTQTGKTLGKVSVKAKEDEKETPLWMTLNFWGDHGKAVSGIRKGDPIFAVGEVNKREYNGKEYYDFNAEFVSVMGGGLPTAFSPPSGLGGDASSAFTDLGNDDGELPF